MIVDSFVLAPHSPTTCVVLRYVDSELHEHGPPLEVHGQWFGAIGEDSMQVAVIDDEGRRLRLFELGEHALRETEAPPLPVGVIADSVVLSDAVMFIGCHGDEKQGNRNREKLFALDLRAAEADWKPAPMWYNLQQFDRRKAIDELFVDGDRLLAIDDVVFPRYSVIYTIHERTRLELVKSVKMQDHTSYESVRAATLGRRWLAVINVGINHGTYLEFVSVLERESLDECIYYSYVSNPSRGPAQTSGGITESKGLFFVGDVLTLAGGTAGLGIVDLRNYELRAAVPFVRYRRVGDLGRVDRVLGMRGRDVCVAVELAKEGPHRIRHFELTDEAIASW